MTEERREPRPEDYAGRHPGVVGLLRWFEYEHLPPHLQAISRDVALLAFGMVDRLPDGPELTTGLRKLLEAKDCLVRAAIDAGPQMTRSGPVHPAAGPDRPLEGDELPDGRCHPERGVHAIPHRGCILR